VAVHVVDGNVTVADALDPLVPLTPAFVVSVLFTVNSLGTKTSNDEKFEFPPGLRLYSLAVMLPDGPVNLLMHWAQLALFPPEQVVHGPLLGFISRAKIFSGGGLFAALPGIATATKRPMANKAPSRARLVLVVPMDISSSPPRVGTQRASVPRPGGLDGPSTVGRSSVERQGALGLITA
jgi:hypothetical protein